MREKKWLVKSQPQELVEEICKDIKVSDIVARLLINRGLESKADIDTFLNKGIDSLNNPYLLSEMETAVKRIEDAIDRKEKITVYGDYDADGITSVAMLVHYFKKIGADIDYYIPDRLDEGYGINTAALKKIKDGGTSLIITVDNGITAVNEAVYAKEIGLDLIITDHHECKEVMPSCIAIINPKKAGCNYPFKNLSGAGVAFKLICALAGEERLNEIIDTYIEYVCIATIADVMPILHENRTIVALGLQRINNMSRNPGIRALIAAAGFESNKKVTTSLISYALAPRINAAGRLGDAGRAVKLFLEDSYKRAFDIAEELCFENRSRQTAEGDIMEQAENIITNEFDITRDKILVIDCENWHHGIIGIVASRLLEKYCLPCILISFDGDVGKGSGRSVKGFNLFGALEHSKDFLIKYGGHEMAVGFTISREKFNDFKKHIGEYTRNNLTDEDLHSVLEIECEISENDISLELGRELQKLEPYGNGNPLPVFMLSDVSITDILPIGKDRHLRLTLAKGDVSFCALYFGMSPRDFMFTVCDYVNVVGNLDINSFRGEDIPQFIIRDIKLAKDSFSDDYKDEYERFKADNAYILPKGAVPDRDDLRAVYTFIIRQSNAGYNEYNISVLCRNINRDLKRNMNYSGIMLAIDILEELELIDVERKSEYFNIVPKTSLKKVQLNDSKLWTMISQ